MSAEIIGNTPPENASMQENIELVFNFYFDKNIYVSSFYYDKMGALIPRLYASDVNVRLEHGKAPTSLHRGLTKINTIDPLRELGGHGIFYPSSLLGCWGATFPPYVKYEICNF
jgi:hypothetical protein